ncbi:MAG: recombinase family protein [Pirellula sp.]
MNSSDSIQSSHLTRRAAIYIRQSTAGQVANNQESLRLQYALKHRAIELGWPEPRIDIVDCDLGQSGATVEGRLGFQQLIEEVALEQIGILISYDATRLARNCSHWYQLLDLCGRTDCLIADRDGVYDPSSINGRLLLGLKGQISELELHTIRARLNAGLLCKAKRGDLALMLPAGLERNAMGEVVKSANIEVQDRLTMIFQLMLSKRTIPKVMRELRALDLCIPRCDHFGDIQWRPPTTTRIANILRNPAYAGAFAYGKTKVIYENGRAVKRKRLVGNQWKILIKDRYPAYVSWNDYERIGAMLSDNHSQYSFKESRGIARDGSALLQGIAYCGNCGRKMTVQYKPKARYNCTHRHSSAGEPTCQNVWANVVDENALKHFFQALSIAEIDLSQQTLRDADKQHLSLRRSQEQQIERLRHAADLARRQYDYSAPENRLVTAELERRWEDALRELRSAEELLERTDPQKACWVIPVELVEILKDLGPQLPKLWESGHLNWERKKSLIRTLVDKVVMKRVHDEVEVRIIWRGGANTTSRARITVGRFEQLGQSEELRNEILRMVGEGKNDRHIAEALTASGHHSPRKDSFLASTVARIRTHAGIIRPGCKAQPHRIDGYLRANQIAKELGVPAYWIYDRIRNGTIKIAKDDKLQTYAFPDSEETREKLRSLRAGEVQTITIIEAST